MTFEDGRKIVAPTWPQRNFEGLADMENGDKVRILFTEKRSGVLSVRRVELLRPSAM
jgi:hypothetical protein